MGNHIIQGQWSLNEASTSIYDLARGVLQAATSDNVQPLAILACEQFGNTLAISQETRLKIERTVLPTPEPVPLHYLKVKVGFLKHDCAVQLGSNQAGLRFLALAAALLSSLSRFECAQALASMLEATATNKQYLPTIRHLTDLMSSIEGRCRLAGFADVVYGYHSIISGIARTKGLKYEQEPLVPNVKGLTTLIDVFRQMQRLGEHEVESVVVEAYGSAAWIAAFSKWSLETPPSVYLADGTPVAPQPESKVDIIVIDPKYYTGGNKSRYPMPGKTIIITKKFKIESLQDLIIESSCYPLLAACYIGFGTYRAQIQDVYGHHEWLKKAIFAAVPLAIRLVLEQIQSGLEFRPGNADGLNGLENSLSIESLTVTKPTPFPRIEKVFETMSLFLGLPQDFPSEKLASAKSFRDLQDVENYFEHAPESEGVDPPTLGFMGGDVYSVDEVLKSPLWTKEDSRISRTSEYLRKVLRSNSTEASAPTKISLNGIIRALAFISHIILLLSLFDSLTEVLFVPVWRYHHRNLRSNNLYNKCLDALVSKGSSGDFKAFTVFPDICRLVLFEEDLEGIIMKSSQSHCFWFSALDNPLLSTRGYLSIICRRGRIIHGRESYTAVHDRGQSHWGLYGHATVAGKLTSESVISGPFSRIKFEYKIFISEDGISAAMSVINEENFEQRVYPHHSFLDALGNMNKLNLINCEHPAETNFNHLSNSERELRYATKLWGSYPIRPPGTITIFLVGGNKWLQMYLLSAMENQHLGEKHTIHNIAILRQSACLNCCVRACEELDCIYLMG